MKTKKKQKDQRPKCAECTCVLDSFNTIKILNTDQETVCDVCRDKENVKERWARIQQDFEASFALTRNQRPVNKITARLHEIPNEHDPEYVHAATKKKFELREQRLKTKPIYISGKITGLEKEVYTKLFNQAEKELREQGFMVIVNPLNIHDEKTNTWQGFMLTDIAALFTCKSIFMLNNWHQSKGAKIERYIAAELGLNIIHQYNPKFVK